MLNFCLYFQQIFLFLFISDPLTKDEFNQGKKGLQDGISNLNDSVGSFDTENPNFLIAISKISIVEFWAIAIANLLCVKQLIFNKKIQSEVADYAQQIKWIKFMHIVPTLFENGNKDVKIVLFTEIPFRDHSTSHNSTIDHTNY